MEAALDREVPAFVYLVPDFQNPAGATLSLEKRRAVVELANRFGFWFSFFVSVMLPEDANTDNLVDRARECGPILTPGASFFADPADEPVYGDRFVRLPFCAVMPEPFDEGVRRLVSLL